MAELVDALASGASVRKYVEVQVLLSAPQIDQTAALQPKCGRLGEPPIGFSWGEKHFGQPLAAPFWFFSRRWRF